MSSKINSVLLKHRVGLSHKDMRILKKKDMRILEWLSILPYFGTVVYDLKILFSFSWNKITHPGATMLY